MLQSRSSQICPIGSKCRRRAAVQQLVVPKRLQHLRGSIDDEDGPRTPMREQLLTWLHLADVELDRPPAAILDGATIRPNCGAPLEGVCCRPFARPWLTLVGYCRGREFVQPLRRPSSLTVVPGAGHRDLPGEVARVVHGLWSLPPKLMTYAGNMGSVTELVFVEHSPADINAHHLPQSIQ
jgi:hypothetical protein